MIKERDMTSMTATLSTRYGKSHDDLIEKILHETRTLLHHEEVAI